MSNVSLLARQQLNTSPHLLSRGEFVYKFVQPSQEPDSVAMARCGIDIDEPCVEVSGDKKEALVLRQLGNAASEHGKNVDYLRNFVDVVKHDISPTSEGEVYDKDGRKVAIQAGMLVASRLIDIQSASDFINSIMEEDSMFDILSAAFTYPDFMRTISTNPYIDNKRFTDSLVVKLENYIEGVGSDFTWAPVLTCAFDPENYVVVVNNTDGTEEKNDKQLRLFEGDPYFSYRDPTCEHEVFTPVLVGMNPDTVYVTEMGDPAIESKLKDFYSYRPEQTPKPPTLTVV